MALESGTYVPKMEKTVYHWKAPDKDGDGDLVWEDSPDGSARDIAKDKDGNEVRSYEPPKGFKNFPGYDHTDNYVLVDEKGRIKRSPTGEAYGIRPGCSLVVNGDGTAILLQDDRARYDFENSHVRSDGKTDSGGNE